VALEAAMDHHTVVFRDQNLTPDPQGGRRLGPLSLHPGVPHIEGRPEGSLTRDEWCRALLDSSMRGR
jgi:hypothetical protein